jgi:hypothetical protein
LEGEDQLTSCWRFTKVRVQCNVALGFPLLIETVGVSEVGFGAPEIPTTWQRPKRLGQNKINKETDHRFTSSIPSNIQILRTSRMEESKGFTSYKSGPAMANSDTFLAGPFYRTNDTPCRPSSPSRQGCPPSQICGCNRSAYPTSKFSRLCLSLQ